MDKKVKLFIADIDATLRGRKTMVPGKQTLRAFDVMHNRGIIVCIASGRPLWQEVKSHYADWGMSEQFDYLIGLNGGEVWSKQSNSVTHYHPLQPTEIKEILDVMEAVKPTNPFLYREGYTVAEYIDDEMRDSDRRHFSTTIAANPYKEMWSEPTAKLLFRCFTETHGHEAEQYAKQHLGDRYACFLTNPTLLEIQNSQVSKGSGLQKICDELNISTDEVIAFGDAENDIEMLKTAGWSVAVQNAMDSVKAIADDVTEFDADNDGVGQYLFQHVLK